MAKPRHLRFPFRYLQFDGCNVHLGNCRNAVSTLPLVEGPLQLQHTRDFYISKNRYSEVFRFQKHKKLRATRIVAQVHLQKHPRPHFPLLARMSGTSWVITLHVRSIYLYYLYVHCTTVGLQFPLFCRRSVSRAAGGREL